MMVSIAVLLASLSVAPESQPYIAFSVNGAITDATEPVTADMIAEVPTGYVGAWPLSSGPTLLVVSGSRSAGYTQIRQVWQFLSSRIVHGSADQGLNWMQVCHIIFVENRTAYIGCGPCADLFFNVHAYALNGAWANRTKCNMFDSSVLGASPNGHTVNEFYCPDLSRWIIFDLDKGVIPMVSGAPAGILDIVRSHGDISFAFARADTNPIVLAANVAAYRAAWMCVSRDSKTAPYPINFFVAPNLIPAGDDIDATIQGIQTRLSARWPSRVVSVYTDWRCLTPTWAK